MHTGKAACLCRGRPDCTLKPGLADSELMLRPQYATLGGTDLGEDLSVDRGDLIEVVELVQGIGERRRPEQHIDGARAIVVVQLTEPLCQPLLRDSCTGAGDVELCRE